MVREETLRAVLSAKQTIARAMKSAAKGTRDLRDSMVETSGASEGLEQSMDSTENSARTMGQAVDSTRNDMIEAAVAAKILEKRIDRTGDEMKKATIDAHALGASLQGVAAAAGEASVNVGPFNTSVRRAVIALPALLGLVGALSAALVGLATAAAGAAAALGALFLGGIIGRAQELERHSAEIESTMEGLERIFKEFARALDRATEPLQRLGSQDAALNFLEGLVTVIGDISSMFARLAPLFGEVGDRLGNIFWAEEARGIAEMEKLIRDLMPFLEAFVRTILRELPDLLAWLRKEAEKVLPAIGDFTLAFIELIRALSEFTNTILRFTLPAISLLIEGIVFVIDILNAVPDYLYAAATAFIVAAVAVATYAAAASIATAVTGALTTALTVLLSPFLALGAILSPIVALIAGVVAVVAGLITYFNLWDNVINALITAWNTIVGIIEFAINLWISLNQAMVSFVRDIPIIGDGLDLIIKAFVLLAKGIQETRNLIGKLGDAFKWLKNQYDKYIKPIVEGMKELVGSTRAAQRGDRISLEGARIQREGKGETRSGARSAADRGADPSVRRRAREIRENRQTTNIDLSGSSFGGDMTERDVERAVERALEKNRARGDES